MPDSVFKGVSRCHHLIVNLPDLVNMGFDREALPILNQVLAQQLNAIIMKSRHLRREES
ncbi:MAG: hypothetical protein V2J65_30900 [Desulfobacteraceae bacterium]|jgi:hypothetical protein|nr:hypothetical protein [Desulfobacteraceae bacterium]